MISVLEEKRNELSELCRRYRVKRLELFGSAARGEDFSPSTSDMDFIVEFVPDIKRNLFYDYMGLIEDLEKLFSRKVDLVINKEFRNPYFREAVNETRTMIYET